MQLQHPEYIFGIFLFTLLLFLLSKVRRRRGLSYSSHLATRPLGILWSLFMFLPKILYFLVVLTLLISLAAPFIEKTSNEMIIEGKVLIPCIDVSGSMSENLAQMNYRSKLSIVKDVLKEFLKTRDEADAVGLTAFSGGGDQWGAGIIQYPTLDKKMFLEASKRIKSEMFGGSTAIGEGIFVSILAANEDEWNKKLQEESNNPNNEFDISRLWNAVNTLDLPEFGLSTNIEKQDEFIISEAARLTPPYQNRHKVIILFSDGDSNTGLDPIRSIWLATRLGIKVYYIEVRPPESNSMYQPDNIKWLREAISKSGGKYYPATNYDEVRQFFLEISKLEKNKLTTKANTISSESYEFFVWIAVFLFVLWVFLENIFATN